MMQERDYQPLKELVLEFVRTNNPSIFTEIIKKVDRLLLFTIYKARRRRYHLRSIALQDLYHSAIVGLYQALLKVKEDEPGSKIITKIIRYVTNEIVKDNKRSREIPFSSFGLVMEHFANQLIDNTLVYKDLEMEFIRERFWKLIDEDVISFEEFEMVTMRFNDDMTYKEIAVQFGISKDTVSRRIESILCRMKYEFTKRGWEGL